MNNHIYQGHVINKNLGQHFLSDKETILAIIDAINPKPNDKIIEIGPGLGAITKLIINYINYMTVIEFDINLANRLAKHSCLRSKLNIIQKDVMKINFTILAAQLGKPIRIFGNLPYNISTSIILYLLKYINNIQDMHFMFQKEVADRLIASPNNKNYGRLSILVQYYCKIIPILNISAKCFKPIPKVDSTILRIIPYTTLPFPVYNLYNLVELTKTAFHQRRKILRNSLSMLFNEKQLLQQGIDAKLRAENITIEQYCRLANILSNR